MKEKLISIVRT